MDRAIPASSKRLTKRWNARSLEIHQQKLRRVRATVDNRAPKEYLHLHLKLNKIQKEEERLSQIEKDNKILLNKMVVISRKRNTVDNHNEDGIERRSLNTYYRKRELQKITEENQGILGRIQTVQPTYNHVKWEQERAEHEKYLRNIREFPYEGDGRPGQLDERELLELDEQRRKAEEARLREELGRRPRKAGIPQRRTQGAGTTENITRDERASAAARPENAGGAPAPRTSAAPREAGITGVSFKVLEGKGLVAAGKPLPNAYVEVSAGKSAPVKTETMKGSAAPRWEETFEFNNVNEASVLTFTVYNKTSFEPELIGSASVELADLPHGEAQSLWLALHDAQNKATDAELRVNVRTV